MFVVRRFLELGVPAAHVVSSESGFRFASPSCALSAIVKHPACAAAITSLTEHQTRFPSGRLTEERELLFVQALAGMGDAEAAQARASAFAERFPGSIFLPAVRAVSASLRR